MSSSRGKVSLLDQLIHLKKVHESSKIKSEKFQPNEAQQRELIIRNAAQRLVSHSVKRESMKFIYEQKMLIEEKIRQMNGDGDDDSVRSEVSNGTNDAPRRTPHNARTHPRSRTPSHDGDHHQRKYGTKEGSAQHRHHSHRHHGRHGHATSRSVSPTSTMTRFDFTSHTREGKRLSAMMTSRKTSTASTQSETQRGERETERLAPSGRSAGFVSMLTSETATDKVIREIHAQAQEQTRNAKTVFELIARAFDGGKLCQFHPRKAVEELDASAFSTNNVSLAAVTKLEDLSQVKKKDGLLLLFDPALDTQRQLATLKITYMKALDIANEVEVSREHTFWADGNYYGLQLMREFVRPSRHHNHHSHASHNQSHSHSHLGSSTRSRSQSTRLRSNSSHTHTNTPPRGFLSRAQSNSSFYGDIDDSNSQAPSRSISRSTSLRMPTQNTNTNTATQLSPTQTTHHNTLASQSFDSVHGDSNNNKAALSPSLPPDAEIVYEEETETQSPVANATAVAQFSGSEKSSLPGWQGRSFLFVPATKCRLQVTNLTELAKNAAVANSLSRLRIYGVCCANPKAGIKKLLEFLEFQLLHSAVNFPLPGGIAPLNMVALHGNLEAVQQLVSSGASIDYRCKEDQMCTALHAAVIGGHTQIVRFLLGEGASQLVKDATGNCPLHHACRLGHIAIARVLFEGPNGKRALVARNNRDERPVDVSANFFLKATIEGVMRKLRVFVQPRVSLVDRVT